MNNVFRTIIVVSMLFSGLSLAVEYCTECASGSCTNDFPCIGQGVSNATGCISLWINYPSGQNLSFAGCWNPSLGTCQELVDFEEQRGNDAECAICYEDNCNAGI